MKKIREVILLLCVLLICIISVTACNQESIKDDTIYEIGGVEELYAMQSDKKYKLNCDIDLQGRQWVPLSVKSFDGNNHTISNCKINDAVEVSNNSYHCSFFYKCEKVMNLSIKNIVINLNISQKECHVNLAFVNSGYNAVYENVQVKDCSATAILNDASDVRYGCLTTDAISMHGCKIEKCNIYGSGSTYSMAGGLGASINGEIKDCIVDEVTMNIKCGAGYYAGGLFGQNNSGEEISHCVVRNSELKFSGFKSAGGFAGYIYDSMIIGCVSENNTIFFGGSRKVNAGGFIGNVFKASVSDCLSSNNKITITDCPDSYFGGFAGIAQGTLKSSIVSNISIAGASKYSVVAGFVAQVEATVVCCGVSSIDSFSDNAGNKTYQFSPVSSSVMDCCAPADLSLSEWKTPSVLSEKLKLNKSIWNLVDGELPYIQVD